MRLLLDTHAFIWAVAEPAFLSAKARKAIQRADVEILVSAASAWEIAIKYRLGKLPGVKAIIEEYALAIRGLQALELPITRAHALQAGNYPQPHRDPFDRMLAAQAEIEGLTLVSRDPAMKQFGIKLLW